MYSLLKETVFFNFRQQFLRQPSNLSLTFSSRGRILFLEGSKGTFFYKINQKLNYFPKDKTLWLSPGPITKKSEFCLSQVLLSQVCLGVSLGYRCQLNLVGIGFHAFLENENGLSYLIIKVGFSHLVRLLIPDYLDVSCPKSRVILVRGINLQKVNDFAALVRKIKLPNSYKEKGLYYKGESLKLKQGKKT